MKRLILGGLSVVLLSTAIAPAVKAEVTVKPVAQATVATDTIPERVATRMAVTPFNLVFLAFQGFFEQQGIPSSMRLISEYVKGKVTATDLVKIAVDMNRLPSNALNDRGFINDVESQLMGLSAPN
ncbi:MAG: hypothetical protein ICV63_15005 [Coleofasciculus sp. Co-bin14]|nr:hypothetical protein [Coleofasciculus sp. Co-bin14]